MTLDREIVELRRRVAELEADLRPRLPETFRVYADTNTSAPRTLGECLRGVVADRDRRDAPR